MKSSFYKISMAKKTCTPFCDDQKPCPKHHELLLAVLNCSDTRYKGDNELSFLNFETCVKTHLNKGWDKNDVVPDPVKEFRFPLIHWASVLGKSRAIEWMIQHGFDATIQAADTKETALHRFVLCLNQAHVSSRIKQAKMGSMIGALKDCLKVHDSDLDTPLLVAAKTLVIGRKTNIFEDLIEIMVDKAKEYFGDKCSDILNLQNVDGNTAMHILAKNDISFISIRKIFQAGGDPTIINNDYKTVIDIATENDSTRIVKLLSQQLGSERGKTRIDDEFTTESPPESEEEVLHVTETEKNTAEKTDNSADVPPVDDSSKNQEETQANGNAQETGPHMTPQTALVPPRPRDEVSPEKGTSPLPAAAPVCSSSGGLVCTCIVKEEYLHTPQKSKLVPDCQLSSSSSSPPGDAVLVEFLKGAGLLESVKKLAMDTRSEDEKILQSKLREIQATQEELEKKDQNMEKLKEDIVKIQEDMSHLEEESNTLKRKRKSLSLECSQIEKKLHYCDSLLRVVPQKSTDHELSIDLES